MTCSTAGTSGASSCTSTEPAGKDDHLRYFNAFLAGLAAQFSHYLQRPRIDFLADGFGYGTVLLNLSDEDVVAMTRDLNAALIPYLRNEATSGRRSRRFTTVPMPADGGPGREA
ncbi:MAG TPA: hypothetical protein VOB72_11345 [Candidatus Dormibacteraeota bacterium]|nr:hypothetical protein [Candidatus Dormibacteraeota bacterium]